MLVPLLTNIGLFGLLLDARPWARAAVLKSLSGSRRVCKVLKRALRQFSTLKGPLRCTKGSSPDK